MRRTPLALLLGTLLAVLLALGAAAGPTLAQGGIGVAGADGSRAEATGPAPGLGAAVGSAAPRVAASYAKSLRRAELSLTAALGAAAGATGPHVSAAYAKSLRAQALSFPKALIDDTTAPKVVGQPRVSASGGGLVLSWETDEFATGELRVGTTAGAFGPPIALDALFRKQHRVELPASAVAGARRFFVRIGGVDVSGNTMSPSDFTLTIGSRLFLPLVRR